MTLLKTALTCQHKLTFCAGHRVHGTANRCAHLHGHNYALFATAIADELDAQGRIIDFSALRRTLGTWINDKWDRGFLLHRNDKAAIGIVQGFLIDDEASIVQKLYLLPYNPTAENLARYLLEDICPELFAGQPIAIREIMIRETDNCYAAATLYDAGDDDDE